MGAFFCGPDDYIFGSPLQKKYKHFYSFNDKDAIKEYLNGLESEKIKMSIRNRTQIYKITVTHTNE